MGDCCRWQFTTWGVEIESLAEILPDIVALGEDIPFLWRFSVAMQHEVLRDSVGTGKKVVPRRCDLFSLSHFDLQKPGTPQE